MTAAWAPVGGAMALVHAGLIRFLRRSKYAKAPQACPTTWGDWVGAALSGLGVTALALVHPLGAVLGIGLASVMFGFLWLDAALYRVFTFELGVGGAGGRRCPTCIGQ